MRRYFLLLSLSALAPCSAFAADLPTSKPAPAIFSPAPAADWRGFYAGSFVGATVGVYTTRETGSASFSGSGAGFTTGALAGYNWQTGAFVYGVEGDIGSNSAEHKFAAAPGFVANEVENIYALHGRARLGYDLGAFMPFVAGGLAYGRSEQFQRGALTFDGDTKSRVGWTIGAGVDAKVNLPILGPSILRGEYLYDSYPATSFDLNGPVMRTNIADHTFRVALISRFDEAWRPPAAPDKIDWSGDYFGVLGGGAWDSLTTTGLGASTKFSGSGPIGGVYSGHNWMFGDMVLGIEGATMLADISGHGPQPGAATTNYRDYFQSDFRGRAGYAIGRFLPFFAAGIAYGASRQIDVATGNNQGLVPAWAWTVGLGADYMLTERLAVRAEYLYSRSFSNDQTHLDSVTCCAQRRTDDSLRVGLAYFFH
ncbi:MAG TPA: outer membrane beta-barrel protein [Roseiarcus sp.]|nr:outer membrane beta-barrel protein [Roseiarcus sp.]